VWGVICLQSFGGLNVAFILRYADNILKGFAAAFSTVASCLLEVAFFGFQPSAPFLAGAVLINVAAYVYNTPGQTPQIVERLFGGSPAKGKPALASKTEPDV
jgi:UDP-sugar transporter A1/2/3